MGTSLGTYFKQLHAYSEKVTEDTVMHYEELESAFAEWKEAKEKVNPKHTSKKCNKIRLIARLTNYKTIIFSMKISQCF